MIPASRDAASSTHRRHVWRGLVGAIGLMLCCQAAPVQAQTSGWRLAPNPGLGHIRDYKPKFDKHFELVDGVIAGKCGLTKQFFEDRTKEGGVFTSVGALWFTNDSWPQSIENFELTFDYKWFQEEPLKNYGDFPDLHVGFRLNENEGYYMRWGMLGQIITRRLEGGNEEGGSEYPVSMGTHPGVKGKWTKVKIRAAGPIIKVKIWPESKPEPEHWSSEAFDDWGDSGRYGAGGIALGFAGRKHFDHCVYEFKDIQIKPLSDAEVAAEKFFDSATAPTHVGYAKNSDTSEVVPAGQKLKFDGPATIESFDRDANLKVGTVDEQGLSISSQDGKPAYLWVPVEAAAKQWGFKAKATGEARPLFAIRVTDAEGKTRMGYMDPSWREGIAALLLEGDSHTVGAFKFEFKPDTWYNCLVEKAHWQKWQVIEEGNSANRMAYAASLFHTSPPARPKKVEMGIGIAGQGSLLVPHTMQKP